MFKELSLLALLLVFLSGCVQPPICGNGLCESGESSQNCPEDCRAPSSVLLIGRPSSALQTIFNQKTDLELTVMSDISQLDENPEETLASYDIVILDQHLGVTPKEKAVSRATGQVIENYARAGGSFILVMDSGIYRSGGIYGEGVAADVVGWRVNFGDIIPVECNLNDNYIPTCTQPIALMARIYPSDSSHKTMEGIEVTPPETQSALQLLAFDVKPVGNQIAYIKNEATPSLYAGIVEKELSGKVIYFNYDPGLTPAILENTLEYVK